MAAGVRRIEAATGLDAGEQVIIAGQGTLKDGSPVSILETEDDQGEATRIAASR